MMIRPVEKLSPASPWLDHSDAAALQAAFATLQAGCHSLIAQGASQRKPPADNKLAMRVAGNHLKELDRFFTLLIGEYRAFLCAMAPHTYRRQPADLHPLDKHRPRMRAIRRLQIIACDAPSRQHCARSAQDLALASHGLAGGQAAMGQPFAMDHQALAEVARFYLTLAEHVLGLNWA